MSNPHETLGALEALQADIYRGKILRAHSKTAEKRLADVFEPTNAVMGRIHEGVKWQLGIDEPEEAWKVVRQRLDRLHRMHGEVRFASERPEFRLMTLEAIAAAVVEACESEGVEHMLTGAFADGM